jgi:ribosome recycling factor
MDDALKKLTDKAAADMDHAVEYLKKELSGVRAGKASPALLDGIKVDYYGSAMPINAVGAINTPDARMLTVQVWEKNMVAVVEKAIRAANLGLNPQPDGQLIRIPLPMLTEERRKELVKVCHQFAEKGRIAVRNIRRDANEHIKKTAKDAKLSEDMARAAEDVVQKLTDKHIHLVEDVLKKKEEEILKV